MKAAALLLLAASVAAAEPHVDAQGAARGGVIDAQGAARGGVIDAQGAAPGGLIDAQGAAPGGAIDADDLPPLPVAAEAPSSSATVLAASAAEEEVVVGAAKREQSLGNVASAVTVVTADRIRRFGYRTVGEAVAAVAGVYLVDNRLSYSIGIRGLQVPGDFNTRILVLVDGASINEAWGAYAGLGFDAIVGIDEIARIEVIRGPVSSVYGTNAFFGIINIVTRGAAETPRAWARAGGHSIAGLVTSAGFAIGGIDRQLRGAFQFADRIGENVALPDGGDTHVDGDRGRAFAASVVGAYDGTFAQVRAVRADRASPFAPYEVNPAFQPYEQVNEQLLVEGGHTRDVGERLSVAARAYANLYEFTDHSPPSDPTIDFPLDTTGRAQVVGAELRGRRALGEREQYGVTAGSELSYNRTRSTATVANAPDAPIADVPKTFSLGGLYTEVDGQPAPWFGFVGGLRYDRHSALTDKLSPRAALFFAKPERYGVKLLYAQGFRNASAYEGFFFDDRDFQQADRLAPETIRSFEAVLWAKPVAGLSTRLSGFYWDARDLVEALASPSMPDLLQFQNTTRYVSFGGEAEASYRNAAGWLAFGGLALTRVGTEDTAGTLGFGSVTNAPLVTASLGVSSPKLGDVAHVSSETILIGERPTRATEDGTPSPGAPAWVGWNVTVYVPDVRGFDVTVGVRNLLGKRELIPTPGDYDRSVLEDRLVARVPGEGREFFMKAGYAY